MSTTPSSSVAHKSPGVYLFVRQTLDWTDERVRSLVIPAFLPKFDAWNDTFAMPYQVFRQRLKAIAALNLSRVDAARVTTLDDVPAGGIVVPVDDDDWFAPDLGQQILREWTPNAAGCLWRRALLEYTPPGVAVRRRIARWIGRERYLCKTNNYAFVWAPGLEDVAASHVTASGFFRARLHEVRRIPATLALQNRSLASQTALAWRRPSIDRRELVALFRRHRRLYTEWARPRDLAWAQPYVAMMADLMAELNLNGNAA